MEGGKEECKEREKVWIRDGHGTYGWNKEIGREGVGGRMELE